MVASLVVRLGRVSQPGEHTVTTTYTYSPTKSVSPTPSPAQAASPLPIETPSPSLVPPAIIIGPAPALIIPVAGVRAEQLLDTFDAARSEGRVHDAIDIPAPQDTPVLAAANGKIVKLFQSERGGITIYELSEDQRYFYYYAHLARYVDGLAEGQEVKQGSTIAFVGDTGNAGPGNYHLHFSISIASDPKRWWEGININPYPLLKK